MRKLLLLPVAISAGALRGAVRGALDVVAAALDDGARGRAPAPPPAAKPAPAPPGPPRRASRPSAPPERPRAEPPAVPPAPEAEVLEEIADELGFVDAHVDEPEPELIESEGAADPGGSLRVEEPWPGYARLRAPEVVDRLAAADAATKAVVRLYESTHRGRQTVLAATDA